MNKERRSGNPIIKLIPDKLESKLRKRVEEIEANIEKNKESQRVTNKTMNLVFHAPGQCGNHH